MKDDNMDNIVKVVIKEIIADRGTEVLKEPKVFCSIMDDLIPKEVSIITVFRRTLIPYPEISEKIYALQLLQQRDIDIQILIPHYFKILKQLADVIH